jgi:gliding motility-associated protein GldM
MGGGKLPPRQKMIGMMYLVLTALLAMNVSKDVLNAFVVVNTSLVSTNRVLDEKNNATMADFEKANAKDPGKVGFFYNKAVEAQKMSKEVVDYIEALKANLIMITDKKPQEAADSLKEKLQYVDSKDNYDEPTRIMIGDDAANPKDGEFTAKELRSKIEGLRDGFIKLFSPEDKFRPDVRKSVIETIEKALTPPEKIVIAADGTQEPWELANFYHLPLAAVVTNLSKIQTDIRNVEADVIRALKSAVTELDFTFDQLNAKVIAPSSYILSGDEYKADVLLVASNSSSKPKIIVGDIDTTGGKVTIKQEKGVLEVEGGYGKYAVRTGGEGLQKWAGVIQVEKPGGGVDNYPFFAEYMVAKPAAAVSPDAMNVFYIGIDNPVSVSAAGVAPENLSVTMTGGTITGSKGKYVVRVSGGTEATINVGAKMGDKNQPMGGFKFRVKRIPDPVAKYNGKKGTANISKNDLLSAAGIVADMENFDFDVKVTVQSFDISASIGGFLSTKSSSSNMVTSEQKAMLANVKPGSRVFVENIKVKMPDGTVRDLAPINLKVN